MAGFYRVLSALAVSISLVASAWGQNQIVQFKIVESDPGFSGRIGLNGTLYVKLAYNSDRSVRFRIEGFAAGKKVETGAMYNPGPPYPAGEGEALVWIAYRQPATIDEIRITAANERWNPLTTISTPARIEWSAPVSTRQRTEWAERLSRQQQEVTSREMQKRSEGDEWLGGLIIILGWISILGYFVMQPWMIYRFSGGWRIAALLPILAVVPLFGHAMYALNMGSNLWPIGLIFLMPIAFLYLLAILGSHYLMGRAAKT